MQSKALYLLLALALLGAMAIFAWTNPSYEKAFEAKWYYLTGDYDTALKLAEAAYEEDPYNRMALTTLNRAKIAKIYADYIHEGENYFQTIEAIARHKPIDEADRIRIKMMCEVMLGRYAALPDTPLVDPALKKEAHTIYRKFKELYDSLFKAK